MTSFNTSDAQANWSSLLRRVAAGERIEISEGGQTIALLIPHETTSAPTRSKADMKRIIEEMLARRDKHGPKLGEGETVRDLIEEGRK